MCEPVCDGDRFQAGIAQLVEHNLAKVGVASSSLVSRSKFRTEDEKVGSDETFWREVSSDPTFFYDNLIDGWMAEWLCSGLQSRVRRFDSDPSLHFSIP